MVVLERPTFHLMKFFSGGFICCSWFSNELFINDCKGCWDCGLNQLKLFIFSQTFKPISQRTSESGTKFPYDCLGLCILSCHLYIDPSSKFLVSCRPFVVRNIIKRNHCVEDGLEEDSGIGGFRGIDSVCELPWSPLSSSDSFTTGVDVLGSSILVDG